jgi:uncharacterized membrane protein
MLPEPLHPAVVHLPMALAALAASVLVLVLGIQVGHSGGELVYRHGAALAYANRPAPATDLDGSVSVQPRHGSEDD